MTTPGGTRFRRLGHAVAVCVLCASVSGCATSGSDQEATPSSNCAERLDSVVGFIRVGQSGNGHDALSNAIEGLRTADCPAQWAVFVDYSSGRGTVRQLGPGPCSKLATHGIKPAAIRLLHQDGLCTGGGARSGGASAAETDQPAGGIPWNEARNHVGDDLRVCGPLAGTGRSTDDVFLNLGRDYPDTRRFTIVLWDVGDNEPLPSGARICASGQITDYHGVAQIELRSVSAVEVFP